MTVKNKEIQEQVIRKVQKALALANDNPNDAESQTAMLLAQKLMAQHSLSMKDIDITVDKKKESIVENSVAEGRIHWWQKNLSMIIGENFRCYPIIYRTGGVGRGQSSTKLVFVGKETDADLAIQVFNFANDTIQRLSKAYVKKRGANGDRSVSNAIKNDYITGFLNGLEAKFKEQIEKEGWGLIIVKEGDLVDYYENMNTRKSRSRSSHSSMGDTNAINSGYNDGKSFNHNNKSLDM